MAGKTERITQALSAVELSATLERFANRAELSDEQHRSLASWAVAKSELLLRSSVAGLAGLRDQLETLRREFRAVHAGVAAGWLSTGVIDEELVCRRSFLAHLLDVLEPAVGAEAAPGRMVKAAA